MVAEWVRLCRAKDLAVDDPYVDVMFSDGRRHRVAVVDERDSYRIWAVVARRSVVSSIADAPARAWVRNRGRQLIGFRIDREGRLLAEAWVPKVGLTADEFQFCVRTLAVEGDRFEYVLTGRDAE